ncbi:hypothetical protein C5167_027723 [Papaver somniferum]|nr:hypothetical protein C5167_027723 [Papaver somniferum]
MMWRVSIEEKKKKNTYGNEYSSTDPVRALREEKKRRVKDILEVTTNYHTCLGTKEKMSKFAKRCI